jgi:hypothetical protein
MLLITLSFRSRKPSHPIGRLKREIVGHAKPCHKIFDRLLDEKVGWWTIASAILPCAFDNSPTLQEDNQ